MRVMLAGYVFLCRKERNGSWTGWFQDCDNLFTSGNDLNELFENASLLLT